jgi:hypothetical protein
MDDAEAVQPIEHFDGSSDCILTKAGSKTSSVIASLSSQGAVRPAGERFFGFPNEVPLQDDLLCAIGQLALLSPFELLQIFHQLRKHGSLEMVRDDGLLADCMVGEGGVLEAKCGHRRGREAVLTFVWWRKGTFKFSVGPDHIPGCIPIKIPELMMDAVFMADEIERRSNYLPLPHSPLTLKTDTAPEDIMNCRIGDVFEYVKTHPGATTVEMEDSLALAPTQVRLSLALMGQYGILKELPPNVLLKEEPVPKVITRWYDLNTPIKEETVPPSLQWWYNLIKHYPGGLRLLIAAVPSECTELVWELVKKVAILLEVPAPNVMCSTSGPSFVRLRAPCGGILSLTVLPLIKKNRYLFESFVRTMQACFLTGDEQLSDEASSWKSLIPPTVSYNSYRDGASLYQVLSDHIKQMSAASE